MTRMEAESSLGGYDPMEKCSLIRDHEGIAGFVTFFDVATSEAVTIKELTKPISPNDVLSGNVDALAAVRMLSSRTHAPFFVLDGAKLIGSIQYSDLFGSVFRLCLFALILEVEECAIRSLLRRAPQALETLSPGRIEKAKTVCALRFGIHGAERMTNLVRATTFIDKGTMLSKLQLISSLSDSRLKSVILKAENLRNYCAHPSAEELRVAPILNQHEFCEFIDDCHSIINELVGLNTLIVTGPRT